MTKKRREAARRLHRAHLLCLLGRGSLYDAAACDPLLQVPLLSSSFPPPYPPACFLPS